MSAPIVQAGTGLLYPALRKAGVTLGPGRGPSDAQYEDALQELNRLMGSLNCDRYFIWTLDVLQLPITTAKTQWTIGNITSPAPDFAQARPEMPAQAHLVNGETRTPIPVATPEQWAQRDSGCCAGEWLMYYDRGYPVATIYLSSPLSGTLELWTWHQVPAFVSINDMVQLPPGYEDVLVLNLAVRLAPQFQRQVDPNVRADAREALMRRESINAPRPIAEIGDIGACGCAGFNVYTG